MRGRAASGAARRASVGKAVQTSLPGDRDFDADRIARAVSSVEQLAQVGASSRFADATETEVDLVVGVNHVAHHLGRRPRGLVVTPMVADASFAWGFDWRQQGNQHPDRTADVVVAGTAMRARIAFF